MDIVLIPNREKADAVNAAERLLEMFKGRAATRDARVAILSEPTGDELRALKPDLAVVLGGDGSILSTAQALHSLPIPVVGINFGKLGYLAAYSMEQFVEHLDTIVSGKAPFTERLMLQGSIYARQGEEGGIESLAGLTKLTPRATGVALNDVVINAGSPFRMIELEVQIDEQRTTTFRADGVVVATSSGSTGYNLSAGGPLILPEVEAMVMTPICPHSLSFRPAVMPATSSVLIIPHRLNVGSRVNFDGQVILPLAENECLLIRQCPARFKLIENPVISHWQMLAHKMHWAQSPQH